MKIRAHELCQQIIRPTLVHLDSLTTAHERLLLLAALCRDGTTSGRGGQPLFGPWGMSAQRHRQLWDEFLAGDPELASRVRGLASQHAFLADPELELCVNLRYACAMAWVALRHVQGEQPLRDDLDCLAPVWRRAFAPRGQLRQFYQQAERLQPSQPHVA